MCWCNPNVRTPFCGRPECHAPVCKANIGESCDCGNASVAQLQANANSFADQYHAMVQSLIAGGINIPTSTTGATPPWQVAQVILSAFKRRSSAHRHEPKPIRTDGPAIQDLVIADMEARKKVGLERYGTLLKAHNGRDALMDAYQESLDLCNYLRQLIEERG